jgi:hypothetical protein
VASKRELIRTNKALILKGLVTQLRQDQNTYGPHAATAATALIAEFVRRANLGPDGPPPGHAPLPGLEASHGRTEHRDT